VAGLACCEYGLAALIVRLAPCLALQQLFILLVVNIVHYCCSLLVMTGFITTNVIVHCS
jgi:hypothetical protein